MEDGEWISLGGAPRQEPVAPAVRDPQRARGTGVLRQPIEELRRIYELHQQLFGRTPERFWLPLEGELREEVEGRLGRLGFDSLEAWASVENLEERVNGSAAIDPVVLEALREASA